MFKPRDLSCPKCGAGPLEPCADPNGWTHIERANACAARNAATVGPIPRARVTMYDVDEDPPELPVNGAGGKQMRIGEGR